MIYRDGGVPPRLVGQFAVVRDAITGPANSEILFALSLGLTSGPVPPGFRCVECKLASVMALKP